MPSQAGTVVGNVAAVRVRRAPPPRDTPRRAMPQLVHDSSRLHPARSPGVAISWPTSKQPRQGYAARWRTVESTTARTPQGPDATPAYRSSVLIRRQLPRVATTIEARADRPNTGIVVAPRMFCRAARDLFGCFVRGALRCAREAGMCAGRAGVRTNHPNTALPPALFTGPQAKRPNTRAARCVIRAFSTSSGDGSSGAGVGEDLVGVGRRGEGAQLVECVVEFRGGSALREQDGDRLPGRDLPVGLGQ